MTLNYVSCLIILYTALRFVLPLTCPLIGKVLLTGFIVLISGKFFVYRHLGGNFFTPDFPAFVLIAFELGYAALLLLTIFLIIRNLIAIVLFVITKLGYTCTLPSSTSVQNLVLAGFAVLLSSYGIYHSVRVPAIKHVEVAIPNLPQSLAGFRLVQLSDLHIGPILQKEWLEQVVQKTNALQADAIVLTGDMIDGEVSQRQNDIAPLAQLHAKYGVYAVTGNHEYYFNEPVWSRHFTSLGIRMLTNEYVLLGQGRVLDPQKEAVARTERQTKAHSVSAQGETQSGVQPNEYIALLGVPDPRAVLTRPRVKRLVETVPSVPRILLAHRPDAAHTVSGIDLQLSGHTHGGVMFFLAPVIARFNQGMVSGLYQQADKKQVYVSAGTGLWNGFSCRLGVPSEITLLVLQPQQAH